MVFPQPMKPARKIPFFAIDEGEEREVIPCLDGAAHPLFVPWQALGNSNSCGMQELSPADASRSPGTVQVNCTTKRGDRDGGFAAIEAALHEFAGRQTAEGRCQRGRVKREFTLDESFHRPGLQIKLAWREGWMRIQELWLFKI